MINKVAVIGAGVMGSGIAAQIANAGIPVILFDIVPDGAKDRSVIAKSAIQKMLKSQPEAFMHPKNAKLITPANLEDNLELISDCDWIIEVVLEDINIKHATYDKINKYRKKGSIISSNTSTIPLKMLTEGHGDEFAADFMITHFFNPPRYMRLLELVTSDKTRKQAKEEIRNFCDVNLGKGVVECNDTPGFIANRLGVFWMQSGLNELIEQKTSIEIADAVISKPCGIPKTGIFALIDLVGIDLMPHLAESMLSTLPENDEYRKIYKDYPFIHQMIKENYTGRKGKGGFFRLDPQAKNKTKQALKVQADKFSEDFYQKADKPKLESISNGKKGFKAVVTTNDEGGIYAWKVMSRTLAYAASLVPEIADDITLVDEAMRLGYNWKKGPFELIDALGASWFASKLEEEGIKVPKLIKQVGEGTFYKVENGKLHYFGTDGKYHEVKRPKGVLLLRDIKLAKEPIFKTASASLWDIDDGVICLEFTGKMNALDSEVFKTIHKAIKLIGDGSGEYKSLVIYNEGSHFSAGANLGMAMFAMNIAMWPQIDEMVRGGQKAYMALKYASFPVISAPSGMALGGGCEILLHSDHIQAHAETYCGLVEVGVGLVPAWGGCKEMLIRFQEKERKNTKKMWFSPDTTPMGATRKAFEVIGLAQVAKSGEQAKEIGYLRDTDAITMNRDRLLYDAKMKSLELAKGYKPPKAVEEIKLAGESGKIALDMAVADLRKSGKATPYDVVVSDHLSVILSGGKNADWTKPVSEKELLKLEYEEFMKLVHNEETMDRIEHMLTTGKPLRN